MAEFIPKNLGEGQLPSSKGTLYTVPVGKSAIVRSIIVVNTDSVARLVNLYFKPGSTSRRISPMNLTLQAGASYENDIPLTMEAEDVLEGDASSALAVDYVISGVEST